MADAALQTQVTSTDGGCSVSGNAGERTTASIAAPGPGGAVDAERQSGDGCVDCVARKEQRKVRLKQFKPRVSLLTDLYGNDHIQTVYNVLTASFILLLTSMAVNDISEHHMLSINRDLISWHFQGIGTALFLWVVMVGATLVLYGSFTLWACIREQLVDTKYLQQSFDLLSAGAYAGYQLAFLCGPPVLILGTTLAPVTTTALAIEQLRLMMKSHALVRSCAVVREETTRGDHFRHFLYFLFAPTLVYRDAYPRSGRIRWRIAAWHVCEVLALSLCALVAFDHLLRGLLQAFWARPLSAARALAVFCRALLPGLLFLLLTFYAFFHAWMNAWAEVLRFADRRFYEDWWTTTTFATYYRSWNLIVYDWMFEYVYLDLVRITASRGNHVGCKAVVFLVSALFHEYVVGLSLRFLYPVLFVLFGVVGVVLMYLPARRGAVGNILMWLALSVGVAALLTAYCLEYYARRSDSCNAPAQQNAFLDAVIPRSWACTGSH